MVNIPRIVIAGTYSGCGKTTLSAGIMAALVKKGIRVQPFKVGPDYIDPMFHTFITGRHSRNLDSWMLGEDTVLELFQRNVVNTDLALIEGVMGFYDGFGGNSLEGSTAHVSKLIKAPVILTIDGAGISLSIAALIQGFKNFDPDVDIRGIIINNIRSESHFTLLKEVIEENTGIRVVGYLKRNDAYSFESRHLGLVTSDEIDGLKQKIDILADEIQRTIDLELLLKLAEQAEDMKSCMPVTDFHKPEAQFKLAVARDKAFCFYYRDNLDLLELLGAELEYFSPLSDDKLPHGIDGIYIGGGYPEVWACELGKNKNMLEDIKKHIILGIPAYAECGGLMYLSESIVNKNGNEFKMAGVIPGKSEMTSKLQRFGYVEVEFTQDTVLAKKGDTVRAHEFHYSVTSVNPGIETCYKISKNRRNKVATNWNCGYKVHNIVAAYPHIHFWANRGIASNFSESCKKAER